MVANTYSENTDRRLSSEGAVAELSLLLPAWQIGALEQAAEAEGLTVAQLLRRAVNRTLSSMAIHQAGYYYG
jgi:hypothetical protein